jgi:N-acetyl-gamma-glutamyl-phosphate/LysW-gamma-L-alpha-aminoadipyl-6-phosphate reductase
MKPRKVGVFGGSGYIGGEILRYLTAHSQVDVPWVTANSKVGEAIGDVLPNLRGFFDLEFLTLEAGAARLDEVDAAFVCLPHNKSQEVIPDFAAKFPETVFIDLGGDFRTNDPEGYQKFYGKEHVAPELLARFVYGLTEYRREQLRGARLIANPGCFATTLDLALAPLAASGRLSGDVFATGITGSSGSGNSPLLTTHHPERASNVRSYKPLVHQHVLEVEGFLRSLTARPFRLQFVPQSGPLVRGIYATVFTPGIGKQELEEIYREAYDKEALVHVVAGSPELRWVQGTPQSFVGTAGTDTDGVVFSVTDNLGKGAAGQAIQNLNLALGLEETEGLRVAGGYV